jgi:phosphoribosylaminoimidazole-succinocarboxamide synthase
MIIKSRIENEIGKENRYVDFKNLKLFSRGKVRDIYEINEDKLLFIVSDRVSVFDSVVGCIPFKGAVLNGISNWWMEKVKNIVKNHLISIPHSCASIVQKVDPLPVEIIVRGYLTGNSKTSIWTVYNSGMREYCGFQLEENLKKDQKLNKNLVTPTTKGKPGEKDELISKKEIIEKNLVSAEIYEKIEKIALQLFETGQKEAEKSGLILADTKYEFGTEKSGELVLIDEIHTPDSSRYWYLDDYEQRVKEGLSPVGLDKDTIRNYMHSLNYHGEGEIPELSDEIKIEASQKYIKLFEILTKTQFEPDQNKLVDLVNEISKG